MNAIMLVQLALAGLVISLCLLVIISKIIPVIKANPLAAAALFYAVIFIINFLNF